MKDAEICQYDLIGKDGKRKGKIAIIRGGLNKENPIEFMNSIVHDYVKNDLYNEFIEIEMDNPWVRVILDGINELEYEEFNHQTLK